MKKLFLLAGALAAMASCTKTEISDINAGNPDVISFGTYVGQSTRGAIFNQESVEKSGFGIMSYYTEDAAWSNEGGFTPNFMFNQEVTFANNAWSYSPLKYWPNEEGDKLSFFTYAPYAAEGNGVAVEMAKDAEGLPQIAFTVNDDAAEMVDFVAGQNMDMERQKDKVMFNLKHQLTRVQFSAKAIVDNVTEGASATGDGASYLVIKSMNIADGGMFYKKGIYTFNNITTDGDKTNHAQDGTWTVSEPAGYVLASAYEGNVEKANLGGYGENGIIIPIAEDDYTSLFDNDQYLFLLPPNGAEGLAADAKFEVEVVYDIVTVDSKLAAGHSVTESSDVIALPAGTLAQGKAYNFQLGFDVTEVLVDANIVDWDDANADTDGGTSKPTDPTTPTDPTVDPTVDIDMPSTLVDGESITPDTKGEEINFSSDNESITVVNGVITASKPGKATITATDKDGNEVDSWEITVEEIEYAFEATVPETLEEGKTAKIDWTISPEGEVTFESSDDAVLTVDENGNIVAVAEGDATITMKDKYGNVLETATVTVKEVSYTIDAKIPETIVEGKSAQITWTIDPEGEVTFESSDASVLTVDANGKIVAVAEGEATITIKDENGNVLETATVTVTKADDGGKFDYADYYVGNYVDKDGNALFTSSGAIGVIIEVADDHVLVAALSGYTSRYWMNSAALIGGASNQVCGYENTKAIKGACEIANKCWNKGEVTAFLDPSDETKGHWYMPAKNELDVVRGNLSFYKQVSSMGDCNGFWSSTEVNAAKVYGYYAGDWSGEQVNKIVPSYIYDPWGSFPVIRF